MTAATPVEPTLAEVAAQFPRRDCAHGISGLCHARHQATGQQVTGEDPLDLRDQLKAAEHATPGTPSTDPRAVGAVWP